MMADTTRSKSAAIENYIAAGRPLQIFTLRTTVVVASAIVVILMGTATVIFAAETLGYWLPSILVVVGALFLVGVALVMVRSFLDQFNAIKFIRERSFERFKQFPNDFEGCDPVLAETSLGGSYRFSGFSVLGADGSSKANIIYADNKALFSDVFEVSELSLQDDYLLIMTRRTHLSRPENKVDSYQIIRRSDIEKIAAQEVILNSPDGKRSGLYRYLELTTQGGTKHSLSLSHFDPLDERREPDFTEQINALKARIFV